MIRKCHRKRNESTGLLGPILLELEMSLMCQRRDVFAKSRLRRFSSVLWDFMFRNLSEMCEQSAKDFKITLGYNRGVFLRREGESNFVGCVTHIGVGVLRLCFGQRGVTVRAVVFTEVISSLRVGGDQQLLDVSLP